MMERWMTLALFWDAPRTQHCSTLFSDNRSTFNLLRSALQLISGMAADTVVIACLIAAAFVVVTAVRVSCRSGDLPRRRRDSGAACQSARRVLLMLAVRRVPGRFERLFQDGTVFSGVTYTDAHVTLSGTLVVCVALIVGARHRRDAAVRAPRPRLLLATAVPAIACY